VQRELIRLYWFSGHEKYKHMDALLQLALQELDRIASED
jgi:hypothetical protein